MNSSQNQDDQFGGSSSGPSEPPKDTNSSSEEAPLWKYVERLEKQGAGGTWTFKCSFCNETRQGSYYRVKGHLIGPTKRGVVLCKSVPGAKKREMQKLQENYEKKKSASGPKEVPLPCEADSGSLGKRSRSALAPVLALYNVDARKQLDQEIARLFYTAGMPFNIARNPHYYRSYQFAAAATTKIDGYVPPSYNQLRTTLLEKERDNVEKRLETVKSTWKDRGLSIVSDGWSDPNRKPLINFIATSGNGPLFLKAVDCSGEVKDRFFISELMKGVIEEVGHQNVVQIITDNASNCKAAGEMIECMYPRIFWTPCVVHTLNLALKNICAARNVEANAITYTECNWITHVHGDALAIKNFIMNHGMRLSMFSKFCTLKLLSVADTRFASIIVMLKRFLLIKRGLQAMVISEEWTTYKEDDVAKAKFVKDKIVNDDWWEQVAYIIDFTKPIYEMIRVCDTDKACLHLVYEMWDSMIERVKVEIYKKEKRSMDDYNYSPFFEVVHEILIARWTKNNTPLHCLAHSLNPRFYSEEWLNEIPGRMAPHKDSEVSLERMKCFKRMFPSADDYVKVLTEYGQFSMKFGPFEDLTCISSMATMDPRIWWTNFGAQTPLLHNLALKLVGQPSSSSCAERNWSTYAFIHSLRRNRLDPSRARDLVYIHNNLRLLSRNSEEYEDGKTKMWDVGGEFADLSLDEPVFENELFDD